MRYIEKSWLVLFGGGMKETEIQKHIMVYLSLIKIEAWRINNIAAQGRTFHGTYGIPDILGILPPNGKMLAIEVKTPKGKLSEHQKQIREKIEAAGGLYILARSVEDVRFGLIDYFANNC